MTNALKIAFSDAPKGAAKKTGATGAVACAVEEGRKLGAAAQRIDAETAGAVTRALKVSRFNGKTGESLTVVAPVEAGYSRIYLYGVGRGLELLQWQDVGGRLAKALNADGEKDAVVCVDLGAVSAADAAANLAYGAALAGYRFDKYRTKEKASDKPTLKKLSVQSEEPAKARKLYKEFEAVAEGVFFTRDLVSEPPNVLFHRKLRRGAEGAGSARRRGRGAGRGRAGEARHARAARGGPWARVEKVQGGGDEVERRQARRARLLRRQGRHLRHRRHLLKPAGGMEEMTMDMGGAGVVSGVMKALALRKAKANVSARSGWSRTCPTATPSARATS
jgi:leucyl aminopeptidase